MRKILLDKCFFSFAVILTYITGQNIALPGVVMHKQEWMIDPKMETADLVQAFMAGRQGAGSIFALGLTPWMICMMVDLVVQLADRDRKDRSPIERDRNIVVLTAVIAFVQAIPTAMNLEYRRDYLPEPLAFLQPVMAVITMVTGTLILLWLCERNERFGIGSKMVIIIVNISLHMVQTIRVACYLYGDNFPGGRIGFLGVLCLGMFVLSGAVVLFENAERRIPVNRIMVNNRYADKSYLSIRVCPMGIMPVMFVMAIYSLFHSLLPALEGLFPNRPMFRLVAGYFSWDTYIGLGIFLLVLGIGTILFCIFYINPSREAENLKKSGDCIENIYPGKQTKDYLFWVVMIFSCFSALLLVTAVGVPLFIGIRFHIMQQIVMLPISLMMISSMVCNQSFRLDSMIKKYSYTNFFSDY